MGRRKKLYGFVRSFLSVMLVVTGVVCAAVRIADSGMSLPFEIAAAELAMPGGNTGYPEVSEEAAESFAEVSVPAEPAGEKKLPEKQPVAKSSGKNEPVKSQNDFEAHDPTEAGLEAYKSEHDGEQEYPVHEMNITEGNTRYENIQVRNVSSASIDIKSELESELGFTLEKTDEPQVLIYHTHASESYLPYDTGYFYESFFPRDTDTSNNVCAVGEEIAKQLNSAGIVTIHDTTLHDHPSYSGAYDRSLETINKYIEKYPTIKVTLDIHRDGIGTDTEKYKPVFTADGRKAAQVMILAGYNYDGCEEFSDWEYNLRFALRIQDEASKEYPEMMRPLNFADYMYNMNVNTGSLLIEIGSESNTLEEARYAGYLLGKVLGRVLKKQI